MGYAKYKPKQSKSQTKSIKIEPLAKRAQTEKIDHPQLSDSEARTIAKQEQKKETKMREENLVFERSILGNEVYRDKTTQKEYLLNPDGSLTLLK